MDTLLRETVNAVVNSRFPEMSIEGRRQIESILIREEFPKGAIALNEGEVAHEIVFVGKGMLRQYYYKNGKDVTEHFSYEGCIVMCIESFLKQVPTRLIVETLEPSIIYLFPRDMIQKLARENWLHILACCKIRNRDDLKQSREDVHLLHVSMLPKEFRYHILAIL